MDNRLPRKLRLVTGIVLFAYVVSHLANLALGLHSIELMDRLRPVFLKPWQNPLGSVALFGSLALHMVLGLHALYLRRTLRMTPFDGVQLLVGLALPALMVMHVLGTRIAFMLTGFETTYAWIMLIYWKWQPVQGLRQVLVVVLAWAHGCMGLYLWMRLQRWWARIAPFAYPLAFLVPVLALLGFVEAGKEALALADDATWLAAAGAGSDVLDETVVAGLRRAQALFLQAWIAVLVMVLAARAVRQRRGAAVDVIQVRHVGGPTIRAPAGLSLLEISRRGEVPHASLCGGRGRCGTCRVRVLEGSTCLPAPGPLERATLARFAADAEVRLACQCVPLDSPVLIERLVPAGEPAALGAQATLDGRREALVIGFDLWPSGEGDTAAVVFALERFSEAIARGLDAAGAWVVRADARAVRALLDVGGASPDAARAALDVARDLLARVEALDSERTALGHRGAHARAVLHVGSVLIAEGDGRSPPAPVGDALDAIDAACAWSGSKPGSIAFTVAFAALAGLEHVEPDAALAVQEAPVLLALAAGPVAPGGAS